jgi:hypothetical protein
MRVSRVLAAVSNILLMAACTAGNTAGPRPPPVDWKAFDAKPVEATGPQVATAKERALAEAYVSALGSQGFTKLLPLLDDDVRSTFPGMDDAHGRDAVAHAHDVLLGAFEPRTPVVTRVLRTASVQSVEWAVSGVQVKEWMSVPASRKTVVVKGVSLLSTKDDGTVTDIHIYFDIAAAKAQLGVGPKELVTVTAPAMPAGPAGIFEQSGSSAEKANVAVARAAIDALENDDQAGYVDTKTDDVEYYTLEQAQPERGKEAARAYFKAIRKAIAQLDTTIDSSWGAGPFVVLEYTIAGAQLGRLGWIAPQRDKVIVLHVAQINEVRDGKVARVWRYENPLEIVSVP